jgi:hypothetical protein
VTAIFNKINSVKHRCRAERQNLKIPLKKMITSVLSNFGRYLFAAGGGEAGANPTEISGGGQMLVQLPAGELYAQRSSLSGRGGPMHESL